MENLVSIIVPIFNSEKYLNECLNSIIKQTHKNVEIICVNDGSTDQSALILNKYAKKDGRIKVINKPNGGYGHTINTGFAAARGEFVAIVESDDYVSKNMIKFLLKTTIKTDADVVKSDFIEFSNSGERYVMTPTHYSYYNRPLNAKTTPEIFGFKMNTWTGLYRRKFLVDNKILHNETAGAAYQDNGFWFQTLALAKTIVFVSRAFYHYRQDNPNSSINSAGKVFCMCDEYDFIEKFIKSHSLSNEIYDWFIVKKFHNYIYTYSRVADEHKPKFLERFSSEFKQLKSLPRKELFGEQNYAWLEQIINNPSEFAKTFNKKDASNFEKPRENKLKKLFAYLKLFGLKNTIKIISQKAE